MKSVTIRDKTGHILVKVLHRKNGEFEAVTATELNDAITIEARDDENKMVWFSKEGTPVKTKD